MMVTDEDVPTLHDLPTDTQRIVLAYYEAGLDHGYDLGYRAAEAPARRPSWAAFAALARAAVWPASPTTRVCERSGESERAERHRRIVRERGIRP